MTVSKYILIIDHTSALGGAELSLDGLVTAMPQERCHYTVALPGPGSLVDRLREKGIEVDLVPIESWRWWVKTPERTLKFWLSIPLQLMSLARWLKYLRARKPDIVHFNINRLVEPVIAARILGIPSVMHYRDIPSRISYRFVLGIKGFYWLMHMVDCWIANSCATRYDILPFARIPIETIPNAIDLNHFDKMALNGTSDNRDRLLSLAMVAGLVPWKNHPDYIKLAKLICDKRENVRFLIAGVGKPDYTAKLKQIADDLLVNGRVEFLGFVENVPAFLQKVAMLIHTTDREPFGRVFVEAMAARRPVVAFDSGGASEIVVDGETGILVPPGDLDAMAQAVCQLLDDPATRQRIGEAGRMRVEKFYTIEKHFRAVDALYTNLLSGNFK